MDKPPQMQRTALTEKYRVEHSSPMLSPKMGDTFYSRAYEGLIDTNVNTIAECVKEGTELPEGVRNELQKCRRYIMDIKNSRARKIASNALIDSRCEVVSPSKTKSESHMLSKDPRGNELVLYEALRIAFQDFLKDE